MVFRSRALAVTIIALSAGVKGEVISHGDLTTNDDGSTNIITDSLNNYEWLRFDVLAPLTRAETLAVLDTLDGGGWSVAGANQALMFIDTMLSGQSNDCISTTINTACGSTTGWTDGDFGKSYTTGSDLVWYESDVSQAGYIQIDAHFALINNIASWSTYAESDLYSSGETYESIAASWLLYRKVATVAAIDIEKFTNGQQADAENDPDVAQVTPGDTVTWTYEVSNTGAVAFSEAEVAVTDSQSGVDPVLDIGSDDGDMILSPGEVWITLRLHKHSTWQVLQLA
jgi:uncharacterized repeat protein (TIGR01451 family)